MIKIDNLGNVITEIGGGLGINQQGHVTMDIGNNMYIDTTTGNVNSTPWNSTFNNDPWNDED